MLLKSVIVCVIAGCSLYVFHSASVLAQEDSLGGCRLSRDASYFIVCPRVVRPNQVYQISSSILEMYQEQLDVRAVITRYEAEIASVTTTYTTPGTQMLQIWIPDHAEPGNYTLVVEGTESGGLGGSVFYNDTKLIYEGKQASIFIEFNKMVYMQGQLIQFRIMPVEPNLMSRSGSMDVYMQDPSGTFVRRWLSMQTNAGGVLEMECQLSDQPTYGEWMVKVKAWGTWYSKKIRVDEFWVTYMDTNVSMPHQVMEDSYGLAGSIWTNCSLAQGAVGTTNISLQVRLPPGEQDPNVEYEWPTIVRPTEYFNAVQGFLFTMDEIRAVLGDEPIAGRELYVEATTFDWFRVQSATGWAIAVVYSADTIVKLMGDKIRAFKPNQSMDIYWAVSHTDGTPLSRYRRMLSIQGTASTDSGTKAIEAKVLVRDDGIAYYRYVPASDCNFIRLQAHYDIHVASSEELKASRHYTSSNSYISITTSTSRPTVDTYMVFTVKTNTFVENVYYLIMAAGNIIVGNRLEMKSQQKTFSLALSRDMIPEAHIVVWYIRYDEVIADSLNFFVNGTRINKIDLRINRGKDFTGDTIEVNAYADPSSYIGFSGLDYDLWKIGYSPFTTETQMVDELSTYDTLSNASYSHLWALPDEQTEYVHFPAASYAIDANTTFEYAGLVVFTDANVTRIPHNCNETMGWWPCMDGSCFHNDQRCDKVEQCLDGQDEMGCTYPTTSPHTPPTLRMGFVTRHYYETGSWFWGGHFVMPYGRLDVPIQVPDEPQSWLAHAFAISRDLGFGIVHTPVRHQADRPFYMRAEAPGNYIKGEQIGVRMVLNNFWSQNLECLLMLHGSPDYQYIIVESFGIVSSYNPRTSSGDVQTMVYLEQRTSTEIRIPVKPVSDGCITIIVSATTLLYSDTAQLEVCNEYDGVTNYLHTPFFIDLINSGSLVLPDLQVPVPQLFIKPQERQHLYVPGSPTCNIGIVGDVVGPGFYGTYLTTEETLRQPYGAAENNMFNFAYRLYNLKYQKATNQLKPETLSTQLADMNLDLQRQMGYLNSDGSFSQYRDYRTPTPSTWVSAFCLRTLHDAQERDWELDMFIPIDLLNRVTLWLCKQQDSLTGAFYERAPPYDRKHWPRNLTSDERPSNCSLTAYVTIALAASTKVSGEAETCRGDALKLAQHNLEHCLPGLTDVYTLSLVTYALHLLGSPERTKAFYMLVDCRLEGTYVYWADKAVPANNVTWVDNFPYYQPRAQFDNEAYAVETTSYALMTYVIQNRLTDALPIVKWLQTMRNTYAGQASSQDSVAALIALVEYAKLDTNRALYNIEVVVQATSQGNMTSSVRLDSSNWAELQEVPIEPVWGTVRGRAQGTGLALLQMATYVNVEYARQVRPQPFGRFFDVYLGKLIFSGHNFSIMEVTPCARWVRPDLSARSGMAVLEIDVPTGYTITNDILRAYVRSGVVPNMQRAMQIGWKLNFYFDYLDGNETCVTFRIDRWFPIANMTIQHKLKVFDYYEPGMYNSTLYSTWHLFNLHICQVCGSFQCPYCPYYNSAPSRAFSLVLLLVTLIFARQPGADTGF